MPELPEVETIKKQLLKKVKGKTFKKVEVRLPKIVKTDLKIFKKEIVRAKINNIKRRAKVLILELSNNYAIIVHLKMSGQLIFQGQPSKHTHLIYYFTDGSKLIHNDMRQFGYVKLLQKDKLDDLLAKEEKYGPEPLDKNFTLNIFNQLLNKKKKSKIKPLIMDQTFIAGIGNLYADEILFEAGILPIKIVKSLKPKEIAKIYQSIKKILNLAVKHKGSSVDLYIDAEGKQGKFAPLIKVYQREGEKCKCCGSEVKRVKINSRSAHFCPKCQK